MDTQLRKIQSKATDILERCNQLMVSGKCTSRDVSKFDAQWESLADQFEEYEVSSKPKGKKARFAAADVCQAEQDAFDIVNTERDLLATALVLKELEWMIAYMMLVVCRYNNP